MRAGCAGREGGVMLLRLVVVLLMLWGVPASAVLTIEICGHSTSPGDGSCSTPSVVGTDTPQVGASVGALQISDGAGKVGRVNVSPTNAVPLTEGWRAPVNAGDRPLAPLVGSSVKRFGLPSFQGGPNGYPYETALAAAQAFCVIQGYPAAGAGYSGTSENPGSYTCSNGGYSNPSLFQANVIDVCPTGYTLQSGACNLADSEAVVMPSNNYITSQRSGNVHFLTPNDADNTGAASGPLAISAAAGVVSGGNVTGGGAFTVTTGSDGKTLIEVSKDLGNGSTQKWQINVGSPDGSGITKVEGTGSGVYAGTGNLTSGSPAGQTELAAGSKPCGGPGQSPCKIDETGTSDSSSAGAAGSALKGSYDTLKGQADAAATSGDMSAFGVPGFSVPSVTGPDGVRNVFVGSADCNNPTVTMMGQSVELPICSAISPFKAILAWFLSCIAAWYAWYRFSHPQGA